MGKIDVFKKRRNPKSKEAGLSFFLCKMLIEKPLAYRHAHTYTHIYNHALTHTHSLFLMWKSYRGERKGEKRGKNNTMNRWDCTLYVGFEIQ